MQLLLTKLILQADVNGRLAIVINIYPHKCISKRLAVLIGITFFLSSFLSTTYHASLPQFILLSHPVMTFIEPAQQSQTYGYLWKEHCAI